LAWSAHTVCAGGSQHTAIENKPCYPIGQALAGPIASLIGIHAALGLSAGYVVISIAVMLSIASARDLAAGADPIGGPPKVRMSR
jgi:cation transporter-like permease